MQDEMHDPRDNESFPSQVQFAVDAMREGGPGQEALSRLRAGLGLPDPSGEGSSGGSSGDVSSGGEAATGAGWGAAGTSALATPAVKGLAAVGGVVLTLGGIWWASGGSSTPDPIPPEPVTITSVAPRMTPASPASATSPPPSASSASTTRTLTAMSAPPTPKVPSEVELIGRAQASVRSQPQVALNLCREHARRYPNGMLAQEREVLIVEALKRLGKEDEAREQSRSFLESHPDTALRHKVEHLTGDAAP